MLCGVYVGATRLVHGHHEKIAARPCKESRTPEDGRKHVFRVFTFLPVISRSWFALALRGIRDLSFLLIWELPKLYLPTINFYFILLMPLFLWSHTGVCSGSGRRFYALYMEIWHQDWLRIGFALAVRIACTSVTSIMHAYKRGSVI